MNAYLHDYDTTYSPAMPVVTVALMSIEGGPPERSITALIDSGADGSMFPIRLLKQVNAEYARTVSMKGVIGVSIPVDIYITRLRIGSFVLPGVRVIADSQNRQAILGRNVLNQLVVTLDGPGLQSTLTETV